MKRANMGRILASFLVIGMLGMLLVHPLIACGASTMICSEAFNGMQWSDSVNVAGVWNRGSSASNAYTAMPSVPKDGSALYVTNTGIANYYFANPQYRYVVCSFDVYMQADANGSSSFNFELRRYGDVLLRAQGWGGTGYSPLDLMNYNGNIRIDSFGSNQWRNVAFVFDKQTGTTDAYIDHVLAREGYAFINPANLPDLSTGVWALLFNNVGSPAVGTYYDNVKIEVTDSRYPVVPAVTSVDPENGGTIKAGDNITLTFNTAMDTDTLTPANITVQKVGDTANIPYTNYSVQGTKYTLSLAPVQANAQYTITVNTNAKSTFGLPLAQTQSFTFTAVDTEVTDTIMCNQTFESIDWSAQPSIPDTWHKEGSVSGLTTPDMPKNGKALYVWDGTTYFYMPAPKHRYVICSMDMYLPGGSSEANVNFSMRHYGTDLVRTQAWGVSWGGLLDLATSSGNDRRSDYGYNSWRNLIFIYDKQTGLTNAYVDNILVKEGYSLYNTPVDVSDDGWWSFIFYTLAPASATSGVYFDNFKVVTTDENSLLAPVVKSSYPSNSGKMYAGEIIKLNFNTSVDTSTLTPANITIRKLGDTVDISYSNYEATATSYSFGFPGMETGAQYAVTISNSVKSIFGMSAVQSQTLGFTVDASSIGIPQFIAINGTQETDITNSSLVSGTIEARVPLAVSSLPYEITLVLALYDGDKLEKVNVAAFPEGTSGSSLKVSLPVSLSSDQGAYKMKLFMLNGINNMKPLRQTAMIK